MKKVLALIALLGAVAVVGVSVASADDIIPLRVNLQNGQCQNVNNAVNCTGTLTGLGSQSVDVRVDSGFQCVNQGGNPPPGQVSGDSGFQPVPRSGNFDFDVTTNQATCPDHMTLVFTGTEACPGQAQITVTQQYRNRQETTIFCVPIT
jgi:hypothetical protein